jgi:hypothetical protein
MHGDFRVVAHGQHAAGKSTFGDGAIEQLVGGREPGIKLARGWGKRHRHRGRAQAISAPGDAWNRDRNLPANRDFSKKSARRCALRDVVGCKRREPSGRVGEALDQVRAAERRNCRWLTGSKQVAHKDALIIREADIAFAIGDAHE